MSESEEGSSEGEWEIDSEEGSEEESGEGDSWETETEEETLKDPLLIVIDPNNNNTRLNADALQSFSVGSYSIPNPSLDHLNHIEKRFHATFTLDEDTHQLHLSDPKPSRSGLFLNGARVREPVKLADGDEIQVGGGERDEFGEHVGEWPAWSWKLAVEYEDPTAAAEILEARAQAQQEAQERAAAAAAAAAAAVAAAEAAAQKLAMLSSGGRKGIGGASALGAKSGKGPQDEDAKSRAGGQPAKSQPSQEGEAAAAAGGGGRGSELPESLDQAQGDASTPRGGGCGACGGSGDDVGEEGTALGTVDTFDSALVPAAPWWKRHRNPVWSPDGVRKHECDLVMPVKRWTDDRDQGSGGGCIGGGVAGGGGGGDNESGNGVSAGGGGGGGGPAPQRSGLGDALDVELLVARALGEKWVDAPDERPRAVLDVGLCVGLAGPWLQLWELGRVLKTCWHLSRTAAPLAQVTAVSMRGLGENGLPRTPQKLRGEVHRCRTRRKDWGVHAPQRVPEGGWHPAPFVDRAVATCARHFGATLTSLDLGGGVRMTAVALESLVLCAPLLASVKLDRVVGAIGDAGALRACARLAHLSLSRATLNSLAHLLGSPFGELSQRKTSRARAKGKGKSSSSSSSSAAKDDDEEEESRRHRRQSGRRRASGRRKRNRSSAYDDSSSSGGGGRRSTSVGGRQVENDTPASLALEELNVSRTNVFDAGPLMHCSHALLKLDLSHTCVADVTPLRRLRRLESLDLASCPVVELGPLGGCTRLTFLNLQATQAVGLANLRPCGRLQVLDCSRTPLRFVDGLLGMASLHTLRLADTRVESVAPLRKCFDLRTVDLSRCPAPVAHARDVLFPNCPLLASLAAGPDGDDVIALLNEAERLERKREQALFLRVVFVLRRVQRVFKARLEAKKAAFFARVAEETRRARALGNVDADGNVILPPELRGGFWGGGSSTGSSSSGSDGSGSDGSGSGSSSVSTDDEGSSLSGEGEI